MTGADEKEEYVYKTADPAMNGTVRANPGTPSLVAQEFIAEWDGKRLVWRGDFYRWGKTHWALENIDDVMAEVNRELMYSVFEKWDPKTESFKQMEWNPTNTSLANLKTQLLLQAALPSETEPVSGGEYIFLENGRYSISTGVLLPHDQTVFNLHSSPFPYDPDALCPEWDQFLDTTFGGDAVAIEIHYRWMASELLRAVDRQKAYVLIGQRRSGKGTLMKISDRLLGDGQVTGLSLDQVAGGFNLAPLIGKSVCRISDVRDAGKATGLAVQRLLSIIGAQQVQIDRKNREPWVGELPILFTLESNEELHLPDASGAIVSRFIFSRTSGSREDAMDPTLADRIIRNEMPGILNKVLEHTGMVYDIWPETDAGRETKRSMAMASQPLSAWIEDNGLIIGKEVSIAKGAAYHSYHSWAKENGHARPMTSAVFGRGLFALLPGLVVHRPIIDGKQSPYYVGIGYEDAIEVDSRAEAGE